MNDFTLCTSLHCEYKNSCARQVDSELDSTYKTYYNYEYKCHSNEGFSNFIPRTIEEVITK